MNKTLPRILLTGFDPFDGETINPSWEAVGALHGRRVGGYLVPPAIWVASGPDPQKVSKRLLPLIAPPVS